MLTIQFKPGESLTEESRTAVSELLYTPGVIDELLKHVPLPPVDPAISPATCELSTSIIGESMKQARIPDIRIELKAKQSGPGIDTRIVQSNLELTASLLSAIEKTEVDLKATAHMPPMHLHLIGAGRQADGTHSFTLNIYPALEAALKREPVSSISFRLHEHKAA